MNKLVAAVIMASLAAAPVLAQAADRDAPHEESAWGPRAGWLIAAFVVAGVVIYLASRDHHHPHSP